MDSATIKEEVRKRYGQAAGGGGCCSCGCEPAVTRDATGVAETVSGVVGYSNEEMAAVPEGANLGLGCGNPVALASIRPGDTVLDLGSGGGFDCFLAARETGAEGRVIGVDMTPEMLARARANAERGGYDNVEFRQGEIEALPVEDGSVDVIISNCVINLSPDKPQVFREAFRVLRPGGKIFVSDLVLLRRLPWWARRSMALYAGCVAGALQRGAYLDAIREAGFAPPEVLGQTPYALDVLEVDPALRPIVRVMRWWPGRYFEKLAASVVSLKLSAVKPAA